VLREVRADVGVSGRRSCIEANSTLSSELIEFSSGYAATQERTEL